MQNLRAAPDVQTQLDDLAAKNAAGNISEDERSKLEAYVRAGNLIAILQAKARSVLAQSSQS